MRLHRFLGNFDFSLKSISVSDPEIIHQIRKVLRLGPGDRVILSGREELEAEAKITDIGKGEIKFNIESVRKNKRGPSNEVTLYCSILKKENFELVVQKATEVGVKIIVPIIAKNTVKTGLNLGRLEKIAREAAEQSGRSSVPEIDKIMEFKEALHESTKNKHAWLFDPEGGTSNFQDISGTIGIFIGPEGGFVEEEISLAKEKGVRIISLSPLTFRAETAAMIASYLVCK
jgi:16S rRNA (uracil1498-N3)-methyltransferase